MKKFLFTLAAVLMAGSLCAGEYFQCADYEIPTDKIGKNVNIDVKAHFDAYVSAWQSEVVLPENLTLVGVKKGADMTLTFFDEFGDETSTAPDVTRQGNKLIVACMAASYSEDGDYYGVAKWAPGDYEQMMILVVKATEEFQGGEIKIVTDFSCGEDTREEVNNNRSNEKGAEGVSEVTAEWATPVVEKTATPEIKFEVNEEEQYVDIWAEGDGTIKLYIDDFEVANHFHYAFQEEEDVVVVTATAQEEGKEISDVATLEVTIPAKAEEPPVTEQTEMPTISSENDDDAQVTHVTAVGNGIVILYNDDVEVGRGIGEATWDIPYGELEEEYGVSATAQEDGKLVSEPAVATIYVPAAEVGPEEPYETPAPEVTYEETEDAVIVTAVGEGIVNLYVKEMARDEEEPIVNEPVATGEGEATYTIAKGEEATIYAAWATAQRDDDALVGISETIYIDVPAAEGGEEPPVLEGMYLILIDQDGNEVPFELNEGSDGDFTTTVTLHYYPYGEFFWDPELTDEENEANRPDVPFYFMINGKRYGAEELTETVLGYAMQNPLTEGAEDYYYVPVGFSYTLGVAFKDDVYYVYAAISKPTGLDELNGEKTVAGVRYFNLAGQEMQEANGMTIVVTTYTDGTTSAVKVMK